jgi:hypothetical protein
MKYLVPRVRPGGSEGGTPGSVMAGRAHGTELLGSVPGAVRASERMERDVRMAGPVRVGARGVETKSDWCVHGPRVAASDCRHDGMRRGSGRYSVRVQLRRFPEVRDPLGVGAARTQ